MPNVRYHTIAGQVRATTVSGGYNTALLPDALGSVVRTINGASGGLTLR